MNKANVVRPSNQYRRIVLTAVAYSLHDALTMAAIAAYEESAAYYAVAIYDDSVAQDLGEAPIAYGILNGGAWAKYGRRPVVARLATCNGPRLVRRPAPGPGAPR